MRSSKNMPFSVVQDVCKPGSPSTCSFLLMGEGGWQCAKSPGNEGFRRILESRRVAGTIKAMGDNCDGWNVVTDVVAHV